MQKSIGVAIVSCNKLLILLRGSTAPYNPNKYCLPGGMVDNNESLIDCAVRETYEETGLVIDVAILEPLIIKYPSGYKKTIFVYKTDLIDHNVAISWEHTDYKWVEPYECQSYQMVPNFDLTLQSLINNKYLTTGVYS